MSTAQDEANLKQLFRELRERDRRAAPAFGRLIRPNLAGSPDATRHRGHVLALRLAVLAALLLAVASGWWTVTTGRSRPNRFDVEPERWTALSGRPALTDPLPAMAASLYESLSRTPLDSWFSSSNTGSDAVPNIERKETL